MNDFTPPKPAVSETAIVIQPTGSIQIVAARALADPMVGGTYLHGVDESQWSAVRSSPACFTRDSVTGEYYAMTYTIDNGAGNFSFMGVLGRGSHPNDTYWYVPAN